jgi:hypothetical protein
MLMLRGRAILPVLLIALFVLAAGCGGDSAPDGENDAASGEDPPAGENGGGTGAEEGGGPDEEAAEPEPPFEAVTAPPDAEPVAVQEQYCPEEGEADSAQYGQYPGEQPVADQSLGQLDLCSPPGGEMLPEGVEDNTEGPLGEHRILAYYGHPYESAMGILGEYEPEEFAERLRSTAEAYALADPETPVIPTIELIASVAQRDPGEDGLYLFRTPPEVIEEYSQLAEENGFLLMLDIQLGRSTIAEEVEALMPFLERPHVHLAIDTEYSVEEGQVPGIDLGTVDGADVQEAIETVSELVEREGLPHKIVLVHQFEPVIVQNKEAISPTDNVQVVLHADGFGGLEPKVSKYDMLVTQEPIQYGGFKVFYRQDTPVMTPEQVLRLEPAPAVVTYQ